MEGVSRLREGSPLGAVGSGRFGGPFRGVVDGAIAALRLAAAAGLVLTGADGGRGSGPYDCGTGGGLLADPGAPFPQPPLTRDTGGDFFGGGATVALPYTPPGALVQLVPVPLLFLVVLVLLVVAYVVSAELTNWGSTGESRTMSVRGAPDLDAEAHDPAGGSNRRRATTLP